MDDLKLIDELLVLMKRPDQSWEEFENSYNITQEAMARLRNAYLSGEMEWITASLAIYFDREKALDELTQQAQDLDMGYQELTNE